ncbi:MAG: dihydrolipoamide acetyltransferase family protein [Rhabdochlamydiaceae bacterium]|nr:dihydrolipoamide acetyltransferase family protein [Candidatus Amphrikana amoebophyrae]
MSEEFEVKMPKLGESIVSATVVSWMKKVGDRVDLDEPLLEVSTDKVNSEIPSPVAGVLKEIRAKEEQTYDVDAVICVIETSQATTGEIDQTPIHAQPTEDQSDRSGFYSPAVLRFAKENGIAMSELETIKGSGGGGRLSRKDIQRYLSEKGGPSTHSSLERVKMTGMRKAIADHMVKSFYQAPHATLVSEVDVTDILDHIKSVKESFLAENGAKLTITTYIMMAIAKAALKFPYINASLDGDTIVLKKFVNVGIAVSVDQAILVPVVRNAHSMSAVDMAKSVADLAGKAKSQTLSPDEVQAGTITMTNFGMGGALIGIPIIRFPEVAIVGVGKLDRKLCVMDDDSTAIRTKVHLSLTFDHRVIDGMYGCGYLEEVKRILESGQ